MSGGHVLICQCVMQLDKMIGQTKFSLRAEKCINFPSLALVALCCHWGRVGAAELGLDLGSRQVFLWGIHIQLAFWTSQAQLAGEAVLVLLHVLVEQGSVAEMVRATVGVSPGISLS